jgi:catechol 2,3-dioxygenase-like lactoylglutathione lyase family enzyme
LAVRTHGLTHIALAVSSPAASLRFYRAVLGVVAVYRSKDFIQAQTPGSRDVLVFQRSRALAGRRGGAHHFGFRLRRVVDFGAAVKAIERAGGFIEDQGEFVPGEPYVFFRDPDGYLIEIWYELPTPVDPPARVRASRRRRIKPASRSVH